ncbi:ACT domain-containing protein [candidate division WOR-3 bacterium]|uniref:aspartate kinase n=1 Tax=candidate division WOR-3 bacterium TaxID=2052148 RepID=A0A9D5QD04_UNCW3|nr:ACT domain-containing protein [candidate division WOR-3 bacterium]MBD3364541.1 ACT domain-containing protein [candidate division WOR-3 bacterium]
MGSAVELVEIKTNMAMVVAKSVPDRPGIAAELFSHLGSGGFNILMIAESKLTENRADISFALEDKYVTKAVEHLKGLASLDNPEFIVKHEMGMLTVYGKKLSREMGIAGKVFSLLAQEAINIEMISTSFSSISVLIEEPYLKPARNLISKEFELDV